MQKIQEYLTFLSPEFIYVPFDKQELLSLPKSMEVFNNSLLGEKSDGKKIFSPISGKIIGMTQTNYNGFSSKSLVIENNFMDLRKKLNPVRDMKKIKKNEIVESLQKYGLDSKFFI